MIIDVLGNLSPWFIETGDVLDGLRALPDNCVHCCVTSPPYWGLRDYGVEGQLGSEPTPAAFVATMVKVFAEVRRVLRKDGTFWLNIGDSYAHNGACGGSSPDGDRRPRQSDADRQQAMNYRVPAGMKAKDMIGIPWMLAFALRDNGWYLRSDIIWHKRSPMPESVRDRPTKSHEHLFLLTKSPKYFYDKYASREPLVGEQAVCGTGKNMRDVWTLSSESYKGAHFATFPTKLVERCLKAGTSECGCCQTCEAPWKRVTTKTRLATRPGRNTKVAGETAATVGNRDPQRHTTTETSAGWLPTCRCAPPNNAPIPCLVLDPFAGAGTTIMVARRLMHRAIGYELNPKYVAMAEARIAKDSPLLNARPSSLDLTLLRASDPRSGHAGSAGPACENRSVPALGV